MTKKNIRLNIPVLARVEGEGALEIDIRGKRIDRLKLKIFEPPRLFEKLLEGRHYSEIPDMVSRICGICPVAYQMSAVLAIEQLFQVSIPDCIAQLRRVFYCGEWIQSHALHIHLLALPDYFGANSVLELAERFPDEVRRGMALQALGNRIISLFGARSINPVGIRVGGFSRLPSQVDVESLLKDIDALEFAARNLLDWVCRLEKSQHQYECLQFSLSESDNYPMMSRTIIGSSLDSLSIDDFLNYFHEEQVDYSTALHAYYKNQHYLVGPLARINLNWQIMDQEIQDNLKRNNVTFPLPNSSHGIIARAAEIWQAIKTAKFILNNVNEYRTPTVVISPKAGTAIGCSEAPRGLLWHQYVVSNQGYIESAKIIPPTSQNQAQIESDVRYSLEKSGLDRPADDMRKLAEQVIRNYDPCISCATHFLQFTVNQHEH